MTGFTWGDQLPTITGARTDLRALQSSDIPALFNVFSDPEVVRYWDGALMTSLTDASAFCAPNQ
jgi:RimJ/RimL family protein N-acetyltransferase